VTTPRRARPVSRPEKQRAFGAVIGAAVGDALGAPFEFGPAGAYLARFPEPVLGGTGEMVGGGAFGWAPGEFTDDTQMALALAESLLEQGRYDADSMWSWFRAWYAEAADVGSTTRAALRHADRSSFERDTVHGAGNGALMRAFPLGVFFLRDDTDEVRRVALEQSALTHGDPAAGWGAWIAVEMIRRAIAGEDPLAALPTILEALPDDQRAVFGPLLAPSWTPDEPHVSNGSVWGCLAEAVWAVRSTSSYATAVVAAIELGGDTDTVACVAGALAGARYGIQAVPARWTTYVHGSIGSPDGSRSYDASALQGLTSRLLGLSEPVDDVPESPAGPVEVDPGVHAADLLGAARVPTDWAVVSLCRTKDRFAEHSVRRQVFLIDQEGDHNLGLEAAVTDAIDAIDSFLDEGRRVVLHCHGGRSRTGLVLKAWKMRRDGLSERDAHEWLAERWHRYQDYNSTFLEFLRSWGPVG
jgi:ADP-ribosyl-[dinitrogen reductase] hydrolase